MKHRFLKIWAFALLLSLTWLWHCDLRAMEGFFCPEMTVIEAKKARVNCHSPKAQESDSFRSKTDPSESRDSDTTNNCYHCLSSEWETSSSSFPELHPYWDVVYVGAYFGINQDFLLGNHKAISKDRASQIVSSLEPSLPLQTNLRIRI